MVGCVGSHDAQDGDDEQDSQGHVGADEGEGEEAFDAEAEKRRALASMPAFIGSGGGGGGAAAPAPYKAPTLRKPPVAARQSTSRPGSAGTKDLRALAARAARFGDSSGADAAPAAASWQNGTSAGGDDGQYLALEPTVRI